MLRRLAGLILLLSVAACGDDVQLRLSGSLHYDDFPGTAVDLSRWTVDTTGDGVTGTVTQTVTGGIATLGLTAVSGDIQNSLLFPVPLVSSLGSQTARIRTLAYTEGPGSNVRFRLYIRPYKDNKYASGPAPDLTSDVFAQLRVRAGTFQAMVSRCIDSSCSSEVIFGALPLGPVMLGTTYDMTLSWDGNTSFYFAVSGVGTTFFNASEGGLFAKSAPSGSPRAKVEVIATSGAPTTGNVSVELDHVDCARWDGDLC